jgi:hypothetical protein
MPFFKDKQCEFVIMPGGFSANVVGILSSAPDKDEYYLWTNESLFEKCEKFKY